MRSYGDVAYKISAGSIEHPGCAESVRTVVYLYPVTGVDDKADGGFHRCKPYFWPLGIDKDSDLVRYGPYVVHYTLRPFYRCVGGIDPCYIHSAFIEHPDKVRLAVDVRNRAYYLCLLLKHIQVRFAAANLTKIS